MSETEIVWRGMMDPITERCRISEDADAVRISSEIEADAFGTCTYTLTTSPAWEFRTLSLSLSGTDLAVERRDGIWYVDGIERPELAAAEDLDLTVSPLTNSLPIRRLKLRPGQQAEIVTAYVSVPDLSVAPDPQRYTRLSLDRYRYESLSTEFHRVLTVDMKGFVREYPGIFARAQG